MSRIKHYQARTLAKRRTGSLYPMVMGMSAVIACLAVAGLEMSRVAGKANQELREQLEARRMAQAGLEFWQRQYNAGAIADPTATLQQSISARSGFSVTATYSSAGADPKGAAQVTSVGRFGNAVQRLTARYEARPTLYENFRCSLYSDTANISFTSSTVNANHWSIARQDTMASLSTIQMDAMTGNAFTGTLANFKQRKISSIPWFINRPSFASNQATYPGSYYLNNGNAVTIQPPKGQEQLLSNPSFSDTTNPIYPWFSNSGASIALDTSSGRGFPIRSARVTGRTNVADSINQDITRLLEIDETYTFSAWVRPKSADSFAIQLTYYNAQNPKGVKTNGTFRALTPSGYGNLTLTTKISAASITSPTRFEIGITSLGTTDFNVDDWSMINNTFPNPQDPTICYISKKLISENDNPFSVDGTAPTSSGLYIVDCRGCKVEIKNCRIRSTLIFINCQSVDLRGGIAWEVVGKNYPAMIVDGAIEDSTNSAVLSENLTKHNFNPATTPFESTSDSLLDDTYDSSIKGAILSTDTIRLGTTNSNEIPQLFGPVLAKNVLSVSNASKSIYFPSDMILNPPPGFYPAFTPMRLIPSSIDEAPSSGPATAVN
jgi:hypothetical protein